MRAIAAFTWAWLLQRAEAARVVGDAHRAKLGQAQPAEVVDVHRDAFGVLTARLRAEQAEVPQLGRQPLTEAVARADGDQRVGAVVLERADDADLVRRQLAQARSRNAGCTRAAVSPSIAAASRLR